MKLEDIRKLCDAATPGPWLESYGYDGGGYPRAFCPACEADSSGESQAEKDAAFIAAARTLVPKLVAVAEAAKDLGLGLTPPEGPEQHADMYSLRNGEVRALFASLAALAQDPEGPVPEGESANGEGVG